MKYRVQGIGLALVEGGHLAGTPAVSVTAWPAAHGGGDGPGPALMDAGEAARRALARWAGRPGPRCGRPWALLRAAPWHLIQAAGRAEDILAGDAGPLIAELRGRGFRVAVQTSGVFSQPSPGADWLSVVPPPGLFRTACPQAGPWGDELLAPWPEPARTPLEAEAVLAPLGRLSFRHRFLVATRPSQRAAAEEWCLDNPSWRLCPSSERD